MSAFVVPTPVGGTATGWGVVDWLDATYKSPPADAAGTATLYLPQLDLSRLWRLTHMVASCSSTLLTQLRLYVDTVAVEALRDGTGSGNFDVSDWPAGLLVLPGRGLVAQWTGATPGAVGVLTVQGEVLMQAAG